MEKGKIELTISKKLLKNLFVSVICSFIIVFIMEFLFMDKPEFGHWYGSKTFYTETIFGESIFNNSSRLECAILALLEEKDFIAVLIVTLIFWVFSIINHFVRFKIK